MLHSVTEPVRGYFIASLVCAVGELGDRFVGHYKIFRSQPKCFCEGADHVAVGCSSESYVNAAAALSAAETEGRRAVESLETCVVADTGCFQYQVSAICTCRR